MKWIFGILITLSLPLANAKEWAFNVYLNKSKIGSHTFTLNDNQLISKAKFNVKVLFIEAYKYDHTAKEQWSGDCLTSLEANTLEDKIATKVTAKIQANSLMVNDGKATQNLPKCSMTFAYWNPKLIEQKQLLNPQNAEFLDTKFKKIGQETIVVKSQPTETTHYQLSGLLNGLQKLNIDLWYDTNQEWVALQSTTPEGYKIMYKLK